MRGKAIGPHALIVLFPLYWVLVTSFKVEVEVEAAVKDVARQVQLETLLDRYPRQLSGGQRQRVALARAMTRRPAAFLMDEPLSNLDAKLRGYMRAELKHMQHQLGITTLYVTHDQIEAMTLGHRVALLEKGMLQQLDTPANIYNAPANLFVAGFIGSPPMNFFDGEFAEGHFSGPAGSFGTKTRGSQHQAVAGVRPEDCKVTEPDSGKIVGEVYATELMGDHTLVTCRVRQRHDDGQGRQVLRPAGWRPDRGRFRRRGCLCLRQGFGQPHPLTSSSLGEGVGLLENGVGMHLA